MSRTIRKPVLLVVDDDRLVLEALGAELRDAFGELCRVEAFDDPAAALAATAAWDAEGRALAVVVADQKMPGMPGVELVRALRARACAAAMRAILLTGYASLDNAVAAKNEAQVDRFLEKPWAREELLRAVRRLLAVHLATTGADTYMSFRQATTPREIREQLRLRYEVYRAVPSLAHYFPKNEYGLAVDTFDRGATYGAIYRMSLAGETPVGSVRIVDAQRDEGAPAIVALVADAPELRQRALAERPAELPLLTIWPQAARIRALLEEWRAAGERAVEIGRLAVAPGARGAGAHGLVATLLLMEGIAGLTADVLGIENSLLTCNVQHARFYAAMGMRPAAGGDREYVEKNREWLLCLHARPEWLPAPQRERIGAIVDRLGQRGRACRCDNFAACVDGPYRTGRFADVDLFCAERAGQLLAPVAGVAS